MKPLRILVAAILPFLLTTVSAQENPQIYPFQNPKLSVEKRVDDLITRLTPEEKVGMMMNRSAAVERLGIPAYNWWGEACHGLMGVSGVTVFPQCIALAATFDEAAELKAYTMVSDEARGRYNSLPRTGDIGPYVSALPNLTFWAPNVNIFRDPRWGRGQETYGEDPYLSSVMGLNVVRGMQGNDPKYYKTHACAKHFAIHSGPEPLRHKFNVDPSGRDLWETYLPAFKTLVTEGNVQEVMCAYSAYQGEPCCNSSRLLIQILRERWGYKGLVVSDCDAINDFYNKGAHGTHDNAIIASYLTASSNWTISSIPEWLTVSPASGSAGQQTVTFSVGAATETQTATLQLECAGKTQLINVLQLTAKADLPLSTCAQVEAGEDGKSYRVKGTCTAIANTTYGNWYLNDGTGEVYIYGTLDAAGQEKNFLSLGIDVGDIVTVEGPRTNYNGTIELVNVTVIDIEKSLIRQALAMSCLIRALL